MLQKWRQQNYNHRKVTISRRNHLLCKFYSTLLMLHNIGSMILHTLPPQSFIKGHQTPPSICVLTKGFPCYCFTCICAVEHQNEITTIRNYQAHKRRLIFSVGCHLKLRHAHEPPTPPISTLLGNENDTIWE